MTISGSRAMGICEPCQVREEAAVSGPSHVTRSIPGVVMDKCCFFYGFFAWAPPEKRYETFQIIYDKIVWYFSIENFYGG